MSNSNGNGSRSGYSATNRAVGRGSGELPSAWVTFIGYCQQLRHGEVERLKIQDGLPVLAEMVREKVKFS